MMCATKALTSRADTLKACILLLSSFPSIYNILQWIMGLVSEGNCNHKTCIITIILIYATGAPSIGSFFSMNTKNNCYILSSVHSLFSMYLYQYPWHNLLCIAVLISMKCLEQKLYKICTRKQIKYGQKSYWKCRDQPFVLQKMFNLESP